MKQLVTTGFLLLCSYVLPAQSVYQFEKGLAIGPCHRYGREALYTDQLAYLLYQNALPTPTVSKSLSSDSPQDTHWQAVTADKDHKFKGPSFNNGYLYLTYESNREQTALLHTTGHNMAYVNGAPHAGDPYASGWLFVPVLLKKGLNELYVRTSQFSRYQGLVAELIFPDKPISLNTDDPTLPSIVLGNQTEPIWAAIVVVNTSTKPLTGLQIQAQLAGNSLPTDVPTVAPMTTRKIGFRLNASGVRQKGDVKAQIRLMQAGKTMDEKEISLSAVEPLNHQNHTFVSNIDGSVQYYGVAPQQQPDGKAPALFLSVHGAGVEASGQARAYQPKDWGVIVAPTNRRPRGFNWEDWGRLDALEVLAIGKQQYKPDPQRIYLTGHSMGGHGTWYLGATLPGNWAAIAPCAGYPTLADYGSHDGKIPTEGGTPVENLLLRASNPSNVLALATNYKPLGVYVLHGDADRTVSVDYARQMRKLLSTYHPDFAYYEYPGGSHWYSNESVDWKPLFEYFRAHRIPVDSAVHNIDFTTANPAISSTMRWIGIEQQRQPLQLSRVQLKRDKRARTISGSTENVDLLRINLSDFQPGEVVTIQLDSLKAITYKVSGTADKLYLARKDGWELSTQPTAEQKNPRRSGTFKEPFNNRMVFVYGTSGTADENNWAYNKARYDAETWYYRGNGAVDMIADKDFNAGQYANRGVVLYGNATSNRAWSKLLANCPIQASRGTLTVGSERYTGDSIGAYFVWPRPDSPTASVAVITGTGLPGLKATDANQYFAGGSGFPDFMIFDLTMLRDGVKGVRKAGFFDNNWSLTNSQTASKVTAP